MVDRLLDELDAFLDAADVADHPTGVVVVGDQFARQVDLVGLASELFGRDQCCDRGCGRHDSDRLGVRVTNGGDPSEFVVAPFGGPAELLGVLDGQARLPVVALHFHQLLDECSGGVIAVVGDPRAVVDLAYPPGTEPAVAVVEAVLIGDVVGCSGVVDRDEAAEVVAVLGRGARRAHDLVLELAPASGEVEGEGRRTGIRGDSRDVVAHQVVRVARDRARRIGDLEGLAERVHVVPGLHRIGWRDALPRSRRVDVDQLVPADVHPSSDHTQFRIGLDRHRHQRIARQRPHERVGDRGDPIAGLGDFRDAVGDAVLGGRLFAAECGAGEGACCAVVDDGAVIGHRAAELIEGLACRDLTSVARCGRARSDHPCVTLGLGDAAEAVDEGDRVDRGGGVVARSVVGAGRIVAVEVVDVTRDRMGVAGVVGVVLEGDQRRRRAARGHLRHQRVPTEFVIGVVARRAVGVGPRGDTTRQRVERRGGRDADLISGRVDSTGQCRGGIGLVDVEFLDLGDVAVAIVVVGVPHRVPLTVLAGWGHHQFVVAVLVDGHVGDGQGR